MNRFLESRKYAHGAIGRQERYDRYRGTARVDISHLKLDRSGERSNLEHVETLKREFTNRGCYRLEPANRVAALVSQQELANLLLYSDLS